MSVLHEMKIGNHPVPERDPMPYHVRQKILYREKKQPHPEKRVDRLNYLKSLRSKGKKKTAKAMMKV